MSELKKAKPRTWMSPVGWCLIIGAMVVYAGCWFMYASSGEQAEEQAFNAQIQSQQRMYSGGRRSEFNSNARTTANATQHSIRRLIDQYTPAILAAGVLGVILVLMSRNRNASAQSNSSRQKKKRKKRRRNGVKVETVSGTE